MTLSSQGPQERSWRPQEADSYTSNTSPCLSLPVTVQLHSPTPELTCPSTGPRGCSWPPSASSSGQAGGWPETPAPIPECVSPQVATGRWCPKLAPIPLTEASRVRAGRIKALDATALTEGVLCLVGIEGVRGDAIGSLRDTDKELQLSFTEINPVKTSVGNALWPGSQGHEDTSCLRLGPILKTWRPISLEHDNSGLPAHKTSDLELPTAAQA